MHTRHALATVATAAFMRGTSPPADACSLLTLAEVNKVVSPTLKAGEHPFGGPLACGWTEAGGATITNNRVLLTVTSPERFDRAKAPVARITKAPLAGVGDDAYYITTPGYGTTLNVKKGSNAFGISVKGDKFSEDEDKAMEKVLAQDVLARI